MPAHAQRMSSLLASDKEFADCRVERRACDAGRGAGQETGGHWSGDGARSVQGWARLQIGSRARRGAHREHFAHVCDAGRVEAQRLVERPRALPRVERKACGAGRGMGVGGQQAVDDRGARSVQGRARLQIGGRARGGAHLEHQVHVCDAGGIEAQRLVERKRALPSRKKGIRCGERCGAGRGAGGRKGGGCRRCKQRVQGRNRLQIGRANPEHLAHGCDLGRVEAQRLVDHPRALPRVKRRACGAGRGIRVGVQQAVDDRGGKQRAREGAAADWGQSTGRSARGTCRACL